LKAAHLCEQMGEWPQAQAIYEALMKQLPPLQAVLKKRRDDAKAQLENAK